MLDEGTILGGYRIVREIGRGAMATVHEALQIRLRRRVALKVLHPEFATEPKLVRRFLREAETAGGLQHAGIVTVHDRGQDGRVPFIVMELVEGPTLDDIVRAAKGIGPTTTEEIERLTAYPGPGTPVRDRIEWAVDAGIQVAEALQAAHEQDVVHRDVKPSNILMANGRAKVADFGLASVRDESHLTATKERIGTPAYMSPEQALGREVDVRSDVYSLGATIYELVTLRRSIEGRSLQDFFQRIPREDPSPARKVLPEVSKDLETILVTAMRKEPDQRYPSARALAEDLDRYRRGEEIAARPDGPLRKAWRTGQRHPVLRLGVIAILVGLISALALWQLWPGDPDRSFLTITTNDGGHHPVKVIPLDEDGLPRYEVAVELGQTPLTSEPLAYSGRCRIVVGDGVAFAEILEEARLREHLEVKARLLPTDEVRKEMILVPEGEYPLPKVTTRIGGARQRIRGFHIDKHEVTKAEFEEYLLDVGVGDRIAFLWGGCNKDPASPAQLSWIDAQKFALWAGKRLPTALEWLAAYVAPDGTPPTKGHDRSGDSVRAVGTTPEDVTGLGIMDMYGNVSEYTTTWNLFPPDPMRVDQVLRRLILGRSTDNLWSGSRPDRLHGSQRLDPSDSSRWIGFRCVKSAEPR